MAKVSSMRGLDEEILRVVEQLGQVARGVTVEVFDSLLDKTPQYHGRMVASWNYSIGTPYYVDRSNLVDLDSNVPQHAGSSEAIGIAKAMNSGADALFKFGDKVFITNAVDHGEGPYSQDVEDGNVNLRPENLPGAPVSRTVDQIAQKYGKITPAEFAALKSLSI